MCQIYIFFYIEMVLSVEKIFKKKQQKTISMWKLSSRLCHAALLSVLIQQQGFVSRSVGVLMFSWFQYVNHLVEENVLLYVNFAACVKSTENFHQCILEMVTFLSFMRYFSFTWLNTGWQDQMVQCVPFDLRLDSRHAEVMKGKLKTCDKVDPNDGCCWNNSSVQMMHDITVVWSLILRLIRKCFSNTYRCFWSVKYLL